MAYKQTLFDFMDDAQPNPLVTTRGLEFADRLENLISLPFECPEEVESWEVAAGELDSWIMEHFDELPLGVPHYLYHYFIDTDIRFEDASYRLYQEELIERFIRQLRGEQLSKSKRRSWHLW